MSKNNKKTPIITTYTQRYHVDIPCDASHVEELRCDIEAIVGIGNAHVHQCRESVKPYSVQCDTLYENKALVDALIAKWTKINVEILEGDK